MGLMGISPYRVQGLGTRENGSNPLEPPDYEVFILSDDSDTERDRRTPSTVRRGIVNRGGEYVQITGQYTMREGATEISSVTNTLEGPVVSVYSEEASRSELNLLSATTMEVEGATTIEGKAALATYGSNLLCAASEKGFFIFDYVIGFSLTGKTTLSAALQEKEMDEMVIHDDIAYIVDDVLFPWYLLRVGLSTQTNPTYLEVVEIGGVNQTLNHQWLNPAQNQWLLHQSTTTMAGNSENVIGSLASGDSELLLVSDNFL